jgi:tetratricopeptide (TPR) repeat protein
MAEQQDMFENPISRARDLKARRRFGDAMEILKKELERHPDNLKVKASLADLYYRTERYKEASTLAGEILRDDPDDPRALVVMGNVLQARKKSAEALEYFNLALKVAETDYLWARVARCRLDSRDPAGALEAISRGQGLNPEGRELLRLKAEAARAGKDPATERDALQRVARLAPGDAEGFAHFVMPLLHDLPGRRAAQASERMRETPGQELNPHLLLFESLVHLKGGDPAKALARLESMMKQELPQELLEEAHQLKQRAEAASPKQTGG